jgi:uncharacterized protein (TIGR00251 family)
VPTWRDAVQEAPPGVRLLVEVSAGAREARFPDGFNPWRGRIGLRVRAPAQEGRANQEVVASVAAFFGVPGARVALEAGHLDARKSLLVAGVGKAAAEARLEGALGP